MAWTILLQGAKELRDEALADLAGQAHAHTRSARSRGSGRNRPPGAGRPVGALDVGGQAAISVPKRVSVGRVDPGLDLGSRRRLRMLLLAVVGALGVLVGRPWLGPSIGPSAVLIAMLPAHPTAPRLEHARRTHRRVARRVRGRLLVGAVNEPVVLVTGILTWPRVAASVIAVARDGRPSGS
jgi:hypothetical protein